MRAMRWISSKATAIPLGLCMLSLHVDGLAVSRAEEASLIEPGATVKKVADGMKFTEGPVWLAAEKKLIFSDIPSGKLMQWTAAGGLSELRKAEQPNGNALDPEGRLVTCQHGGRNIVRTEPDGTITVVAATLDGKKFNSPNDLAIRSDGTIWFTDPGWGGHRHEIPGHYVFRFDPKTSKVMPIVTDLPMPNGIVFSPDEKRIYIADTGGNARHPNPAMHKLPGVIRCHEIAANGLLGTKVFEIPAGSDGMEVDEQGNLYTTWGSVTIYSPEGKKLEVIKVPEHATNVCFGDDDLRTLYITAGKSLYSVRMKNAGLKPKTAAAK